MLYPIIKCRCGLRNIIHINSFSIFYFVSLKSLLKLPKDRPLHAQLETSVRQLLSVEKDRDVYQAIRSAIIELDRTEIADSVSIPYAKLVLSFHEYQILS